MIRVGVFNGDIHKRGLTLHNFTVLNELEDTESPVEEFNLVGRYLKFKEHLMENRIYLVNIQDDPTKPIRYYEVLDKAKFIKYVDGDYIITYKRYGGQSMIDLYEARPEEFQAYMDWVLKRGKKSKRTHLNTFTKNIIERIFYNYGYKGIIRYDSDKELKKWQENNLARVKAFNKKRSEEKSNWSEEEIELLILEMAKAPEDRMSEKELSKRLGRTVPSIATKKWKLKSESYKSKYLNMKDRAKLISEKLKSFRKEKEWSQGKLSKESGVSLSIVNQLECMNYTNTDTAKVTDLLNYLDSNSEHITIEDIPTSTEAPKRNKRGRKKVEKQLETQEKIVEQSETNKSIEKPKEENQNELVSEVKHLSDKIDNVLKSHISLQIENSKLKNDKENLLRVLTNFISEQKLESQAV